MAQIILRRLAVFLLTALLASIAMFVLLSVVPGDPAQVALGTNASPEALEAQRQALGLDVPLWQQYLQWISGVVVGDFGISAVTQQPIGPELASRLSVTVALVTCGTLVALAIAIPAGIYAAVRSRKLDGLIISGLSQIGIAVPGFLAGMLLITVFAVSLGWFPAGGWSRPGDGIGSFLAHATLPALAIGSVQGAVLTRYTRASILEVMHEDFLRTARAKGLRPLQALFRHGLRNAAIPVITILGIQLSALLIGAVVIERVFVIRGIGTLLLERIANRDMLAVQGIALVLVLAVLLINLVVDLLYTVIDPRLKKDA